MTKVASQCACILHKVEFSTSEEGGGQSGRLHLRSFSKANRKNLSDLGIVAILKKKVKGKSVVLLALTLVGTQFQLVLPLPVKSN